MTVNNNQNIDQQRLWLSRRYLVYKLFTNLWFVGAVWLYFYRLFISDRQVGLLDGMAFAIGLVAEVPSGVLADKFGRDKLIKIGHLLAGSGFLIQAFGSSFMPFVIGQAVVMIGVAFVSGADEALFFDQLQFKHPTDWRKLVTKGSQIALLGSTAACVLGARLHEINPRLPWILTGVSFITSVVLIWSVKEKQVATGKLKLLEELKEYLASIKSGFTEFGTQKLLLYVPMIVVVQGLFYAAGWGLLRLILLDRFHFSPFAGSVVVSVSSIISIVLLALMHKFADQLSEKKTLVSISVIAAVSLLLSVGNIGIWGFIVVVALYAGEHVLQPFMSEILNYRTSKQQRATVLSVASFLKTMPYIALAPVIGYLNAQNNLEYFLVAWSCLIVAAVIMYLLLNKRDALIPVSDQDVEVEPLMPQPK